MPFIARCPYCGQRSRVPESSEGSSGQCPRCAAFYTLVAEEAAAAANPAGAPAEPEAAPLAGVTRAVLPGTFVQPPGNGSAPRRRLPARVWLAGLGAAALVLTSAALLSASFRSFAHLLLPLSAAGLLLGLASAWWGLMIGQSKRALLLPGAASGAAAALLLVAKLAPGLLGPAYEASRARRVDPLAMQVVPLPNSRGLENARADWVDADKAALRQGGTLVKITRVWIAPAAPAKSGVAGKEQHLFVRFQVMQAQAKDKDAPPATSRRPKLMDAAGTTHEFREGVAAADEKTAKTPEAKEPGAVASLALGREEVLAFAPPAANVEALRIDVPAERWRATGQFRFTIPANMIERGVR